MREAIGAGSPGSFSRTSEFAEVADGGDELETTRVSGMADKTDYMGLDALPVQAVDSVARWWCEWYLYVGHRRLGRMLISNRNLDVTRNQQLPTLPKRGTRLTPQEMDAIAPAARRALLNLPERQVAVVAQWWKSHYGKEGHRTLGRLLVTHGRRNGTRQEVPQPASPSRQMQADQTLAEIQGQFICRFTSRELDGPAAFSVTLKGGGLWIVLNKLHPLFPQLEPLANDDLQARRELDLVALLLRAWAQTEIIRNVGASERCAIEAREHWGRMLRDLLHAQADEHAPRAYERIGSGTPADLL
jgi:hypothetical protein